MAFERDGHALATASQASSRAEKPLRFPGAGSARRHFSVRLPAPLQVQAERMASPTDDVRALAVGWWSFAHGLAVLFLDRRVQEELKGDQDAVVRRVAATFLSRS